MKMLRAIAISLAMLTGAALPAFADSVIAPAATVIGAPIAAPATTVVTTPSAAGDTTTTISTSAPAVKIPWGDWLDAAISQIVIPLLGMILLGILTTAAAIVSPYLPGWARGIVTAKNIAALDQLLVPSIATGLKAVGSDVAGKTIDVPTKNAAVASAADYAVQHGSAALIKWAGGPEGIRQKIQARFDMIETGVTAAATATVAPASVAVAAPVGSAPTNG